MTIPTRDARDWRCPWCNRIDTKLEMAKLHSLSCHKKAEVLWPAIQKLSKRELKELADNL
jgi:hypothetical protein